MRWGRNKISPPPTINKMKLFVGITDNQWFDFLSRQKDIDEVNFWRPSPDPSVPINPGDLFLFKLHSPRNYIAGGGVLAYTTILPISSAWDTFAEKNGADSFDVMKRQIMNYRGIRTDSREDFKIGCILLAQPFFFDESEVFAPPDWKPSIQRGKTYDLNDETEKYIWRKVENILARKKIFEMDKEYGLQTSDPASARYGKEILIKPRLGQSIFKAIVTDAYNRACVITNERALPVLEAAHIKPYAMRGPHAVNNGLLLRSDLHRLFDHGYMTITPKLDIEVSRRIKKEYENVNIISPSMATRSIYRSGSTTSLPTSF